MTRRMAVDDLIGRLRNVDWEVTNDGERMPDDPARKCVFVDMRPSEFRTLLREAADALESAQMGLRYAVRVWVLSDEIVWSEEEIDEEVESIISDAKKGGWQ